MMVADGGLKSRRAAATSGSNTADVAGDSLPLNYMSEDHPKKRHRKNNTRYFVVEPTIRCLRSVSVGGQQQQQQQQTKQRRLSLVAIVVVVVVIFFFVWRDPSLSMFMTNDSSLHHHYRYGFSNPPIGTASAIVYSQRGGLTATPVGEAYKVHANSGVLSSSLNIDHNHMIKKPRSLGFYFQLDGGILGSERLDPNLHRRLTRKTVDVSSHERRGQVRLRDSKVFYDGSSDPFEEGDCVAQYEWQKHSRPTCNLLHENDLSDSHGVIRNDYNSDGDGEARAVLVNNGYWRDVWKITEYDGTAQVIKTIRYEHDFEERNYDRHRRDAVAMERLSASPRIMDIYAYCAQSSSVEISEEGDLDSTVVQNENLNINGTEKVMLAQQVVAAISDVHFYENKHFASIAHTDITTNQFLYKDGFFKLNDFNRCRFIRWNKKKNEPCGYTIGQNPGTFRSPEEYRYDVQTEKVDVFSMGNIFYVLLTDRYPYDDMDDEKQVQRKVRHGEWPEVPEEFYNNNNNNKASDGNSTNTVDEGTLILRMAMEACWIADQKKRPTSTEVRRFLEAFLLKKQKAVRKFQQKYNLVPSSSSTTPQKHNQHQQQPSKEERVKRQEEQEKEERQEEQEQEQEKEERQEEEQEKEARQEEEQEKEERQEEEQEPE